LSKGASKSFWIVGSKDPTSFSSARRWELSLDGDRVANNGCSIYGIFQEEGQYAVVELQTMGSQDDLG
jgi:hypothetical protein